MERSLRRSGLRLQELEVGALVLGWTFLPGRVEDGWHIEGTYPPAGMHGGAGRSGRRPSRSAHRGVGHRIPVLVPGDPDQPAGGDRRCGLLAGRGDRREERLRGEVLGDRAVPAAGQQVPVDLGQRGVIDVQQPPSPGPAAPVVARSHTHRRLETGFSDGVALEFLASTAGVAAYSLVWRSSG